MFKASRDFDQGGTASGILGGVCLVGIAFGDNAGAGDVRLLISDGSWPPAAGPVD